MAPGDPAQAAGSDLTRRVARDVVPVEVASQPGQGLENGVILGLGPVVASARARNSRDRRQETVDIRGEGEDHLERSVSGRSEGTEGEVPEGGHTEARRRESGLDLGG